jgi:hypothetical protein
MGSRLLSLAGLVAALAPIAACNTQLDPIVVAMNCPDKPLRAPEEFADTPVDQLIDDFEDNNYFLATYAGRDGSWVPATDLSSTLTAAGPSAACAARGTKAGNLSGAGFRPHGASWTGFFAAQTSPTSPAVPYDLTAGGYSGYTGISFWAAIGKGKAPFSLQLGLSTMDTVPNGFICINVPNSALPCFDYYKTTIDLTHTWQRFVIPFSDLAQTNQTLAIPIRLNMAVGFLIWPTETEFDIWFDDIRFEK